LKKSVLSALMVCSVALTSVALPASTFAEDIDSKIQEQNKKIEDLTTKESQAEAELAAIETKLTETADKVDELTTKKATLSEEITKLYSEISDLNVRIQKREVQMQKQARDVQVSGGGASYLDVILNAESISDAITRVQGLTTLVNANNELLEQQNEDKAAVETKTKNVENQIAELEAATKELNEKSASLSTLKLEQEVAKNELEAQRTTEEGKRSEYVAQKEAAKKKLEEEQARQKAAAEKAEQLAVKQAQEAAEAAAAKQAEADAAATAPANTAGSAAESNNTTSNSSAGSNNTVTPVTPDPTPTPTPATPTPPAGNGGVTSAKQAAVNAALADVGNSYGTGWNQQGECLVSVRRWLAAGGINFGYGGPHSGYTASGATQVSWGNVQPGDVVQYENAYSPDAWVGGVHTVLVVAVNGGSVQIVEANNPGGSGYVSTTSGWTPAPPAGFRAVVWRFPG
jgi:peptidoglycan hydrolase CwlO-like protein